MSARDVEELARLGLLLGIAARKDPAAVAMAVLDYLLERSLGDNRSLWDHLRLKAYRAIAAKLQRSEAIS